jgi:hypothetical protein
MTDTQEMQVQLVSSHGMLAILEVLEGKCSRDVIMKLLQMVNLVCHSSLLLSPGVRIDLCVSSSPLISAFWRVSVSLGTSGCTRISLTCD